MSHPSWVCGLKQDVDAVVDTVRSSHPSWVCGLKLLLRHHNRKPHYVTPFVGVWIETRHCYRHVLPILVTPFVGVWIETSAGCKFTATTYGHTLRGCVD